MPVLGAARCVPEAILVRPAGRSHAEGGPCEMRTSLSCWDAVGGMRGQRWGLPAGWEQPQPRCLGEAALTGMERFPTPPSRGRADAAQPTGSTEWVSLVVLSPIGSPIPPAAAPAPWAVLEPTASSSTSFRSLGASLRWHPRTPLLPCPGPQEEQRKPQCHQKAWGWERAKKIELLANGEGLGGKDLLSAQLEGLRVSSPISALPALVYKWRKPHLSSLPQKRNSNKTEVGSSSPGPTAPGRSLLSHPHLGPAAPHLPPTEKSEMA